MRVFGTCVVLGTLMTGAAQASSFVTIEPPKGPAPSVMVIDGPSPLMAAIGAVVAAASKAEKTAAPIPLAFPLPEQSAAPVQISTSIVAFDSPLPDIAYEKVAAIPAPPPSKPKPARGSMPMIMRGGILGDAFPTASAPATASADPNGNGGKADPMPATAAAGKTARAGSAAAKKAAAAPVQAAPPPAPAGPALAGQR